MTQATPFSASRLVAGRPDFAGQRPWASSLRTAAAACFGALGIPSTRDEAWKYTDLSRLCEIPFRTSPAGYGAPQGWETSLMSGAVSLVMIGGRLAGELGTGPVRERWRADSLAHASRNDPSLVEPHLGRRADFRTAPFVALNTAMMLDGAFVYAPPDTVVPVPVQVLHVLPCAEDAFAYHPRVLVVAAEGASVRVVESWIGAAGGSPTLNVPVTEIVVGDGATVDHCVMVREGGESHHLGSVHVELARGSRFSSTLLLSGSVIARREIHTVFRGAAAQCDLQGLYAASSREHVDVRTVVDHAVPRGESRQRYRGVLAGDASSVFHGRVIVRPDAAKTEASQHNANLLLGEGAVANSRPQLEIFADDVRCSHGASVGQIDEEAAFYLRTRGLSAQEATGLLTRAFANEILDGIRESWVRETSSRWFDERVAPAGRGIGGLG